MKICYAWIARKKKKNIQTTRKRERLKESEAVLKGDYNFAGIGKPDDL